MILVVFDVCSYAELNENKENILRLSELEICFKKDLLYKLSSLICCPFEGHYSSVILNYEGLIFDNFQEHNKSHDDLQNGGCFIELKNNNFIDLDILPYILIYKKMVNFK